MSDRYHFKCPVCGYDDVEAGEPAFESQIYCGMCAEDVGRDIKVDRWPVDAGRSSLAEERKP